MKSDCYSPAEKGKLRCHAYQFTPDHHGAPEADGPAGRPFFRREAGGGCQWASWSPVESGNIRSSASKLEQAASEPIATLDGGGMVDGCVGGGRKVLRMITEFHSAMRLL